MAGPWEKYQTPAATPAASVPEAGPWSKYAQAPEMPVVGTFGEGGEVFQMPDGTFSARAPGYSTINQDTIKRLMGGEMPGAIGQSQIDQARIATAPVAARTNEALAGVPFIGQWADEAVGMMGGNEDNVRRLSESMSRENPNETLGLNIGGAIAGSVPMAMAAGGAILGSVASAGGRMLAATGAGIAAGATEGAIAGAGAANDGNRTEGAVRGAVIGGGVGGIAGALAPLVGKGATAIAGRLKSMDVATIASTFGVSRPAARVISRALQNDDLTAAQTALRNIGDDAMLADAGPATANLLDAAASSGGAALTTTRRAVSGRADAAGQALTQAFDDILGAPTARNEAARAIAARTSGARQEAYQTAYGQAVDYSADAGRAIEGILERIPGRTLQAAIREANEAMMEAGGGARQIMAEIAEDGAVTFREMPNVQQLDEIKKALGSVARSEVDQFGRPTAAGLRAQRLAGDLRDAVGEAVPDYLTAVRLGGDKIAEDQAFAVGTRLLTGNVSLEDVQAALRSGGGAARRAAQQGLRTNIEETMARIQRTITDPGVDAREAMSMVKAFSSRSNIAKVQAVIGPERTSRLFEELGRAEAALALRAAVSRNSATAIRQATQGQIVEETTPGVMARTLGNAGNPLEGAREITQTLAGIDPRSMTRRQEAILEEIATTLVETRGTDARRALIAVRRALSGQPLRDAEIEQIGLAVGATAGASIDRIGNQGLSSMGQP